MQLRSPGYPLRQVQWAETRPEVVPAPSGPCLPLLTACHRRRQGNPTGTAPAVCPLPVCPVDGSTHAPGLKLLYQLL